MLLREAKKQTMYALGHIGGKVRMLSAHSVCVRLQDQIGTFFLKIRLKWIYTLFLEGKDRKLQTIYTN